jgi:hypothetical protein
VTSAPQFAFKVASQLLKGCHRDRSVDDRAYARRSSESHDLAATAVLDDLALEIAHHVHPKILMPTVQDEPTAEGAGWIPVIKSLIND